MMADIGPQLPPHFAVNRELTSSEDKDESNIYGPTLPPNYAKNVIGPSLPPNLTAGREDEESSEDDEPEIGPCLAEANCKEIDSNVHVKEDMERRAEAMKNKLTGKATEKVERENWMLELPPELSKNFGLGPRTFRTKAVNLGDRSVWTDTPADRERKRKKDKDATEVVKRTKVEPVPSKEDLLMQGEVAEYNKQHRPQSLLDMHREKLQESGELNKRRPFDRDRDLSLTRSDPKAKAKFIESAKDFGQKFSKGSYEKKFL